MQQPTAILIRGAHVYAPQDKGVQDVLMVAGRVMAIDKALSVTLPHLTVIDGKGKWLTPGFFDQHIHVTGGGGEGGPASRAPELSLSELIAVGTTNVVGVNGTDFVSRSGENLLAKVRALSEEGVNTWMYTSNYHFPPTTICGSVAKDLFAIPECLGVKIALGDHRSSFPTVDDVIHLLADIRLAGMVSGKLGVLHIHSGDIPGAFAMYEEIVARGFPIRHIRPTHCARIRHVFDSAVAFAKAGGYIDLTTGGSCCFGEPHEAVMAALDAGVEASKMTLSTDGHGSMPRFNAKGEVVGMAVCGIEGNLDTVKALVEQHGLPLSTALSFVTKNVADSHGLMTHGRLEEGAVANACLFDDDFTLTDVIAKGQLLMREQVPLVKGTYEA